MAVYVSYTDETASADRSGHFLIAGYVASETDWPYFSRRWSDEILAADPPIPYLHMVEIRSEAWRQEHGITRVQADEKVRKAVQLIATTSYIKPYVAQVLESAYLAAQHRIDDAGIETQRHHDAVDYLVFIAYALMVLTSDDHSGACRINFAISKKRHISHHIQHGLRDELIKGMEEANPALARLFGDVLPLTMEDHMPLQAADVLCWHLQRSHSDLTSEESEVLHNIRVLQEVGFMGSDIRADTLDQLAINLIRIMKVEK